MQNDVRTRLSRQESFELARKVFALRINEGYTYKQISEKVGASPSWISKTLNDPEYRAKFEQPESLQEELAAQAESVVITHALTRKDYDIILENAGGEAPLKLLIDDFMHQIKMGRVQIIGTQPNWGVLDETGYGDATKSVDAGIDYIDPTEIFTD